MTPLDELIDQFDDDGPYWLDADLREEIRRLRDREERRLKNRPAGKPLVEVLAHPPETVKVRKRGGTAARIITKRLTPQQAQRLAKSLADDAEFEDWLRNSPSMGSLRNTAGLIGECVEDLSQAVKRRDWALVESAAGRLRGHANLLIVMADAKRQEDER